MTKSKKVTKFRIAFSLGYYQLREESSRDGFLLFLPLARPSNDQLRTALLSDIGLLYADSASSNTWRADVAQRLDTAGQVLWGWSKSRTGNNPLTWEVWDAFCQRLLGASCALPSRPKEYSLDGLCDEVRALEVAGTALVLGMYPLKTKQWDLQKQRTPAGPSKVVPDDDGE